MLQLVKLATATATKAKTLKPLEVTTELVKDGDLTFSVKIMKPGIVLKPSNLETQVQQKQEEVTEQKTNVVEPKLVFDVFRPFDKTMFVQEYGKYSLVLNKFPVFPNHLLMITTQFEPQTDHLTQSDIGAALDVLEQLKETETSPSWMTFYNRGLFSGASQPHKHVQMVPLQNEETQEEIFVLNQSLERQAGIGQTSVDEYKGIKHGFCSLIQLFQEVSDKQERARLVYEKYVSLLRSLGVWEGVEPKEIESMLIVCEPDREEYLRKKSNNEEVEVHSLSFNLEKYPSYNVLITRKYMLIIPRRLENYDGISSNSLGFMFGLFVKTKEDRNRLVDQIGLLNFIKHITIPSG